MERLGLDVSVTTLRYFMVVAEELHFGRAAQQLHITVPSLSQQMSRLEQRVGVPLLVRTSRRVALTHEGQSLLGPVRRCVAAHEEVLRWARRLHDTQRLTVGLVATAAGPWTTTILTTLTHRVPGLRLELRRLALGDGVHALRERRVDAAFVPGPTRFLHPDVHAIPVLSEQRVLVIAESHPLARRTAIGINETNDLEFIHPAAGCSPELAWWIVDPRPDGTPVKHAPPTEDLEEILTLCATGAGVNISGASAADFFPRKGLAFIPIIDIEPVALSLCYLKSSTSAALTALEQVTTTIAAQPLVTPGTSADRPDP